MNRRLCFAMIAAWATIAVTVQTRAAIIFSDNFSTSTLNSAAPAAPTASSTNYQVLSSKDATGSSIGTGSLNLTMANTSSGFAEIQALFAASPIALSQTGHYLEAKASFTVTGLNQMGNSTLNIALLNSAGAGPVPGTQLNNGQLDDAGVFTTGNAAGWQGYVGRIGRGGGAASQFFTRPAQVGETSAEAQDALFNNAGGGAFDNPTGTVVQGGGAGGTLAGGTAYSLSLRATYDAGTNLVTLQYALSDANGTIDSLSGVTTAATTLATAFDAFSIGFRGTDSIGPFSLNVSSLVIDTNVAVVPEPASLCLLISVVGIAAAHRRLR
jgi:hypothetical protein